MFRENFIQPVALHVAPMGLSFPSVGGLKAKQPRGEGQGATHLLSKHGEHRPGVHRQVVYRPNQADRLCGRSQINQNEYKLGNTS